VLAIVCPGQGSQTPGFLTPWLELPAFASSIDALTEASGIDLRSHGTVSDADTIRDTAVAQPLIVAAGIATLAALESSGSFNFSGVAGHSVGEITAAIASGVLSKEDGIRFVTKRGHEMAAAAALETTTMAAVLGGESAEVAAYLENLGLTPANYNGGGQIVAAGSVEGIAKLQAEPMAGTRVIPLQVAGAFHTDYMKPAVAALGEFATSISVNDPNVTIWSNKDGKSVSQGSTFLASLVSQVSNPVRWDLCMESMIDAGVTAIIEVCPAGTLVGLAKRSMPGIETLALKSPDQLEAALTLAANHA
jgi:[acyl-carrier-protein] S-malonyltransferase